LGKKEQHTRKAFYDNGQSVPAETSEKAGMLFQLVKSLNV
jgi:hypothetical protein